MGSFSSVKSISIISVILFFSISGDPFVVMANNFDSVASLLLNSVMRIVLPFACVTSTPGILCLFTKSLFLGLLLHLRPCDS